MDKKETLHSILVNLKKWLSTDGIVSMQNVQQCLIYKLNFAHQSILNNNRNLSVLHTIQAVLDILWEDLNTGHWSQVSEQKRKLYAVASLFKVIRIVQEATFDSTCSYHHLREAIKAADMGLLMGCGYHKQLSNAAKMLSNFLLPDEFSANSVPVSPTSLKDSPDDWHFPGIVGEQLTAEKCPSLEHFYKNYFHSQNPAKLIGKKDCITHWPAFEKWKDVNYLVTVAGSRMIPIELGSAYTQEDWGMKLIHFEEFVKKFIIKKSDQVGYLAQHQLFDQIPELKNDICTPEYCCLSESEDNTCDAEINAWFGPAGTVSPLHFDPKHNLLCQVFGRKRIILYAPSDSENVYPHDASMLCNTSQLDPYCPDYETYPKFKFAKAFECHLYPGEMLYIPPKWWHHVRSLDTSFSVSFWWE